MTKSKLTILALVLLVGLRGGILFASEDQPVDVVITGRTMFQIHYDTILLSQDFSSYITNEDDDELNFNPRDTRIGFRATVEENDWAYRSVFEVDFYGTNAGNNLIPRLRLGYAEATHRNGIHIRGGQDWLPIAQQMPGTIDFGVLSWGGNLWWRLPQFTVRYDRGQIQTLISVAKHRNSNAQETAEKMPWLMGRVAVSDLVGSKSLVAIGGGIRSVTIDGNSYDPSIICAEFRVPLALGGVVINGEVYAGQGIGRSFVHYGLDYNADHPEGAREIGSTGGFVSLKLPVAKKVDVNLGFGLDDPEDKDLEVSSGLESSYNPPYLKNTVAFANTKVRINKRFGLGAEVTRFETVDRNNTTLDGQRLSLAWWFVF